MLSIRDFLLSVLGGTEFMWDVALGVTIGTVASGIILSILYILFGLWLGES
jgi:hypothetical protein